MPQTRNIFATERPMYGRPIRPLGGNQDISDVKSMKRKVIKQGHNTLTITLPKKWCDDLNIKVGAEIEMQETQNGLLLSSEQGRTRKNISINIDGLDRLALAKLLIACFEQGYESITLVFSKQKIISWSHGKEDITDLIKFLVGRLIGFEVLSQTSNSITIGNLSEKLTKFENIMSRTFFLLEEYLQQWIDAMKSGNMADLNNRESRHDNITRLVALGLRMVSEDRSYSKDEALNYFVVLSVMDKLTDFVRYAYKNTSKLGRKAEKETVLLAEKTHAYLEQYRSFFYKFSWDRVNELDEARGEIKRRYLELSKKSQDEIIISQFDAFTESLHGIIKSRVALELAQNKIK